MFTNSDNFWHKDGKEAYDKTGLTGLGLGLGLGLIQRLLCLKWLTTFLVLQGLVSVLLFLHSTSLHAFDAVNHDVLWRRLEIDFGISRTANHWLRSFVSGRSQYVTVCGEFTNPSTCLSGVPQGSI